MMEDFGWPGDADIPRPDRSGPPGPRDAEDAYAGRISDAERTYLKRGHEVQYCPFTGEFSGEYVPIPKHFPKLVEMQYRVEDGVLMCRGKPVRGKCLVVGGVSYEATHILCYLVTGHLPVLVMSRGLPSRKQDVHYVDQYTFFFGSGLKTADEILFRSARGAGKAAGLEVLRIPAWKWVGLKYLGFEPASVEFLDGNSDNYRLDNLLFTGDDMLVRRKKIWKLEDLKFWKLEEGRVFHLNRDVTNKIRIAGVPVKFAYWMLLHQQDLGFHSVKLKEPSLGLTPDNVVLGSSGYLPECFFERNEEPGDLRTAPAEKPELEFDPWDETYVGSVQIAGKDVALTPSKSRERASKKKQIALQLVEFYVSARQFRALVDTVHRKIGLDTQSVIEEVDGKFSVFFCYRDEKIHLGFTVDKERALRRLELAGELTDQFEHTTQFQYLVDETHRKEKNKVLSPEVEALRLGVSHSELVDICNTLLLGQEIVRSLPEETEAADTPGETR